MKGLIAVCYTHQTLYILTLYCMRAQYCVWVACHMRIYVHHASFGSVLKTILFLLQWDTRVLNDGPRSIDPASHSQLKKEAGMVQTLCHGQISATIQLS